MAEQDEEIVVDLDKADLADVEKAKGGEVVKVEAEQPKTQVIEPEEGIEALRAKLAQAEADRETERNRADNAESRVHQALTVADQSQLQIVTGAIETLTEQKGVLKQRLSAAMAADDHDAAAEIQDQLSIANSKLQNLENGKIAMETAPKREEVRRARASGDPVETMASTMTPKSATWLRRHPEYARNPKLTQRMLAAHNLAITDDLEIESPEYFASIEKTLGVQPPAGNGHDTSESALSDASQPTQRRSSPPASAPVTRGGGGTGSGSRQVRLTRDEVDAARASGLTNEEYARNKEALKKEGRLVH